MNFLGILDYWSIQVEELYKRTVEIALKLINTINLNHSVRNVLICKETKK